MRVISAAGWSTASGAWILDDLGAGSCWLTESGATRKGAALGTRVAGLNLPLRLRQLILTDSAVSEVRSDLPGVRRLSISER